jgi:hypothetical protein
MGDPWIENFVRWSLQVAGFDLAHVKDQWIAMFFQVVLCDRQPSALQDVVLTMLDYYRMSLEQNTQAAVSHPMLEMCGCKRSLWTVGSACSIA